MKAIKYLIMFSVLFTGCSDDTNSNPAQPNMLDNAGTGVSLDPTVSAGTGGAVAGQPSQTVGVATTGGISGSNVTPTGGSSSVSGTDSGVSVTGTGGTTRPTEVFDAGNDGSTATVTGGSGGGGGGGSSGSGTAGTGGAVTLPDGGTDPTMLPTSNGACPNIATGTVQIMGIDVELWVGTRLQDKKGPIYIYWHGTGGSSGFANFDIDPTLKSDILALGGVIAAPNQTTGNGNPIDWGVWTTGDFEVADQIVACAVEQLNIDTRRIYTGGTSAGGLMAGAMAYQRSGYLAASNPNSGGLAPWPGLNLLQDPAHVAATMTMHGAQGTDMVVIDFADVSVAMCNDVKAKGGFAVDCDHGGGHGMAPGDLKAAGWEFMKAHPYGIKPSPYAGGLPASFPSYCKIM